MILLWERIDMSDESGGGIAWTLGVIGVLGAGIIYTMFPSHPLAVTGTMLFLGGIILLIGELLLPTHGVLGIAGTLCFGGVIIVCFRVNQWLGLGVFFLAIVSSPFLFNLTMKLWARSAVGRKIILPPLHVERAPSIVKLGQLGTAVTEMKPMGECDFGDVRIEAVSELGMIPPGRSVKVIAIDNGRPTVRIVEPSAT